MEKLNIKIYSADCQHRDCVPSTIQWVFQGVYLHGDLQSNVGFDLTFVSSDDELRFFNKEISEGMYLVDVIDSYSGKTYENCIMYFWYQKVEQYHDSHWYRGLICLPDDKWANSTALKKFQARDMIM